MRQNKEIFYARINGEEFTDKDKFVQALKNLNQNNYSIEINQTSTPNNDVLEQRTKQENKEELSIREVCENFMSKVRETGFSQQNVNELVVNIKSILDDCVNNNDNVRFERCLHELDVEVADLEDSIDEINSTQIDLLNTIKDIESQIASLNEDKTKLNQLYEDKKLAINDYNQLFTTLDRILYDYERVHLVDERVCLEEQNKHNISKKYTDFIKEILK